MGTIFFQSETNAVKKSPRSAVKTKSLFLILKGKIKIEIIHRNNEIIYKNCNYLEYEWSDDLKSEIFDAWHDCDLT